MQNEKWKRIFKTQQESQPPYLAIISDVDSRRNMKNSYPDRNHGDEEGVSQPKTTGLPVRREHISTKTIVVVKATRSGFRAAE